MMRKVLRLTQKQWNRFDLEKQEVLTKRYHVIISDYKTKRQRIMAILDKVDITRPQGKRNLERGIKKFNDSVDAFDGVMDDLSKSLNTAAGKRDVPVHEQFWGKGKNSIRTDLW